MDELTADAFVNRDDPIPVMDVDASAASTPRADDDAPADGQQAKAGKRARLRAALGGSFSGKAPEAGPSMQDRLMEKLLQQIIPIEDPSREKDPSGTAAPNLVQRPPFNITTMSNNFRRFNSRIGVVFVFQVKVVRLLSWYKTSHTLSFLAVYTFVCLDPYILAVLPLAVLLLAILIPSFIARHPAPPITLSSETFSYSTAGPPIAPAPTVKPVKELSKDFFRNMRDLQNSMEDFSRVHDKIIELITPPTNFSDEPLSSTVFLATFVTASFMFIASHLMPWRLIFLIIGWTITCLGHPKLQEQMLETHTTHVAPLEAPAKSHLNSWIAKDIVLDSAAETREVEIFELQKLTEAGEWESWLFSSSPYDPLSAARIGSDRPKGTRFFEDVRAPAGWEWSEKKWTLDLWSREWVEERIITGVEVETEGERWVYDIRYEGDELFTTPSGLASVETGNGGKKKAKMLPSWEEGGDGVGKRGEWRRRRWVRMVKRRYHDSSESRN
ncbi:integral peroxisomal membrane peroxin [Coleophoma cylindrospora]|uniref:Integral peroxisomal membrane peroxin n=1 Tax=Coleophoma cylindrospora TaxID=1849047 RepID=A0A3D8S764_9HELO|nr:integral peroxisomal membrane peroxin [Coleophoma cylindrospora]